MLLCQIFLPSIFLKFIHIVAYISSTFFLNADWQAALVAQRFSATFRPGCDPGDLGSSPISGSPHGACSSLCLCLCLCVHRHRQREKQAPCREPDMGLDPGTPGSRPGPKAGAELLSHPGIPPFRLLSLP